MLKTGKIWPMLAESISYLGYGALKGVVSSLVRKIATKYKQHLTTYSQFETDEGENDRLFDYFEMVEVFWKQVNESEVLSGMIMNSPLAKSTGVNVDVVSVISSYTDGAFVVDVAKMLFRETARCFDDADSVCELWPEDALPVFNVLAFYRLFSEEAAHDEDTQEKYELIVSHLTTDWCDDERNDLCDLLEKNLKEAYKMDFTKDFNWVSLFVDFYCC